MKPQELSSLLTLFRVLARYDEHMYKTFKESVYDDISETLELAKGLDAGLSVLSLHYSGLEWDKFYDTVDVKESHTRYGMFIPDHIYNIVTYKNERVTVSEIAELFVKANTILKRKPNDKTRKTRTKRAK